jgi:multidrug efflux pump subunit AcrA (membrane-fusion protein)
LRDLAAQGTAIDRGKVGASENMARVQAEHEEAESVLQGAQATLDLASLKLDATKVTAPLDGVVIRVAVSGGDFVEAGTTDLATIVSQGLLYANVFVAEDTAQRIDRARLKRETSSGVSIRFGVRDEEGFPHSASIDVVYPEAQQVSILWVR